MANGAHVVFRAVCSVDTRISHIAGRARAVGSFDGSSAVAIVAPIAQSGWRRQSVANAVRPYRFMR